MKPTGRIVGSNIKLRKLLEVPSKALLQPGEMRLEELAAKLNEYFQQSGIAPGRDITRNMLYSRLTYKSDLKPFIRRKIRSFGRDVAIFHMDDLARIAKLIEAPATPRQALQEGEITLNQLAVKIVEYAKEHGITPSRSTTEGALHVRLRETKDLEPYVIRRIAIHGYKMPVFRISDVPEIVKLFGAPGTLKQAAREGEITLSELGQHIDEYAAKHGIKLIRRTTPAAVRLRLNRTGELNPFIKRKVRIVGYDMPLFHIDDLPEIVKMFTIIEGISPGDKRIEMNPTDQTAKGRIGRVSPPAKPKRDLAEDKVTIHQLADRITERAQKRGIALPRGVSQSMVYKMVIFTKELEPYFKRILKMPGHEMPLFNEADLREIIKVFTKELKKGPRR
jgi:hypothetical protein